MIFTATRNTGEVEEFHLAPVTEESDFRREMFREELRLGYREDRLA
jgi:hypothetical protein